MRPRRRPRALYVRLFRPELLAVLDEEARARRLSRAGLVEQVLIGAIPWPPGAEPSTAAVEALVRRLSARNNTG